MFQLLHPFFLACDSVFYIYIQLTQIENGSLNGLYKTQGLMAVTRVGCMSRLGVQMEADVCH